MKGEITLRGGLFLAALVALFPVGDAVHDSSSSEKARDHHHHHPPDEPHSARGTTTTNDSQVCHAGVVPADSQAAGCRVVQHPEQHHEESSSSSSSFAAPQTTCSLYLAESTIPGAGLGLFSGIDRPVPGSLVGNGDVMFPIVDQLYHFQALREALYDACNEDNVAYDNILVDPTQNYVWFGPEMGMQQETSHPFVAHEYVTAFAPGADAAINCHLALNNAEKKAPLYETMGLHRSKDPGAGAFTPYHKSSTYTTQPVRAFEEIFKFYGNEWFTDRFDMFGHIPLSEDYPAAETLIRTFQNDLGNVMNEAVRSDLWEIMTHMPWPSRTLNALPKDLAQVQTVMDHGIREIHRPSATRSLADLNQNGRCLDYIEPRPSTIRQAGRGAFATQFLPKGTKVAGTPLLFFPTRTFFEMYEGNWMKKDDVPDREKIVNYQILYNYCWHHAESSIFLCPYGAGINYINHHGSSGHQHPEERANVRLQWAANGEMGHEDKWLQQSPKMMLNQATPGLFVDVVAIRDIEPNQEIFLDYGKEWQAAWDRHVARWGTETKYSEEYQSARDWNIANANSVLRLPSEEKEQPYPSHFELKCLHNLNDHIYTNEEALAEWESPENNVFGNPCHIIDRTEYKGEYLYRVIFKEIERIDFSEVTLTTLDEQQWVESGWIVRGALKFMDAPYSTDIWLADAFRHPIGFPDDIFPDAWRGEYVTFEDLVSSAWL